MRDATLHASDAKTLASAWAPRITGTPFSADTSAWQNPVVGVASVYFQLTGQHSFDAGDPCQAFDTSTYLNGTLARFFASQGTDIYYVSHPSSHTCLANQTCAFEKLRVVDVALAVPVERWQCVAPRSVPLASWLGP